MTTSWNDDKRLVDTVVPTDRRRSQRAHIAPNEIVYMNFQSGNGGIVVDVSSVGLGFQAADRVEAADSLSFRLSLPPIQDIEISGQVVWLDQTRKRGGLRFSNLPVEVRKEIQRWLRQYLPPATDAERPSGLKANPVLHNAIGAKCDGSSLNGSATGGGGDFSLSVRQRAPEAPVQVPVSPGAARTSFASAFGLGLPADGTSPSASTPVATSPASIYSSPWSYSALSSPEESQGNRYGLTVSLVVALLLVASGVLYFGNRRRTGDFLIRLGESISGQQSKASAQPPAMGEDTGAEVPTNPVSRTTLPETPDSSGHAGPNPEASGEQVPTSPVEQPQSTDTRMSAGASGTDLDTGSHAAEAPVHASNLPSTERRGATFARGDNGESELAQARRHLEGTGREDRALAMQLLWVAVGKGNSDAEVELAGVYLRGEGGVPKNCEQARILLLAAQKNHNLEASEWLARLRNYGCR